VCRRRSFPLISLLRPLVAILLFAAAAFPASAQPVAASADASDSAETAVRNPVRLSVAYTGETVANVSGGRERGIRYLDNIDIQLEVSLSEYLGGRGLTIFAYGQARTGTDVTAAEVAVEGTYAISPADWLTVTGDLQVVLNPNTRPNLDPAIVPALRVTVTK
jgi:carbohydrate-selective porin OprB